MGPYRAHEGKLEVRAFASGNHPSLLFSFSLPLTPYVPHPRLSTESSLLDLKTIDRVHVQQTLQGSLYHRRHIHIDSLLQKGDITRLHEITTKTTSLHELLFPIKISNIINATTAVMCQMGQPVHIGRRYLFLFNSFGSSLFHRT